MEILTALDRDLELLRKRYELYFQGIEKRPPEVEYLRIQREIRRLAGEYTVNTGIKFKLASLTARFNSLNHYWGRIIKEIEEGRYFRDKFKADMRVGKLEDAQRHVDQEGAGKGKGKEQPGKAAGGKPEAAPVEEDRMASLHKEYMMARLECNQATQGVTREQLKQSIEKTLPALQKQYPGKKIEFKVVIEDGKAKLKAIPK